MGVRTQAAEDVPAPVADDKKAPRHQREPCLMRTYELQSILWIVGPS